jgi:hypothetical protein
MRVLVPLLIRLIALLGAPIGFLPLCAASPTKPRDAGDTDAMIPAHTGGTEPNRTRPAVFARPTTVWMLFYTIFVFNISAELVFGVWATTYAEVSGLVPKNEAPLVATTFYWCYTSFRILTAFVSTFITPTKLIFFFGCARQAVTFICCVSSLTARVGLFHLRLSRSSASSWPSADHFVGHRHVGALAVVDRSCHERHRSCSNFRIRLCTLCTVRHATTRACCRAHVVFDQRG